MYILEETSEYLKIHVTLTYYVCMSNDSEIQRNRLKLALTSPVAK